MILYSYVCEDCTHEFDRYVATSSDRDLVLEIPCGKCGGYHIRRKIVCGGFTIPEGGCGNANNGYSSTHGDSENFKAGRKLYD